VIALVISEPSAFSALGPLAFMAMLLPIGLLLAPQPIRTDKRTIAGLLVSVLLIVGVPIYAAICNVCELCKGDYWWLILECWFI
jgi:hypothetical protein